MTKMVGLTTKQFLTVKQILSEYPYIDFYLYGSRINGNFSRNSDLDVLAKGNSKLSFNLVDELKDKFDRSDLPFIVHISDFYNISKDFWHLIKNSAKKVE